MPKYFLNNKGVSPLFLVIGSLLFASVLLFDPIKNSLNVLSDRIFQSPESRNKERSVQNRNINTNQNNPLAYQRPINVSGTRKIELSYNYLETYKTLERLTTPLYPASFNKNSAHIVFYGEKECEFLKQTRNEETQRLGNSVFSVYDNVQMISPTSEFPDRFYKVVAQTSGRKLIGGKERCGVLIFKNNENLGGKLSTKYPIETRDVAIKDSTRLNKNIHLLIYEPQINNQSIIKHFKWNDPRVLTRNIISFFRSVSGGTLNYRIAKTTVIKDFPAKKARRSSDNPVQYKYSPQEYKDCMSDSSKCFMPDDVDYISILEGINACEDRNANRIDEVWIWGGPYFGFWESHLVGREKDVYFYNSGPTIFDKCQKPLVVMGFNYERSANKAIHNFGHRAESALIEVFKAWNPFLTNGWSRFSIHNRDLPGFAACGNTHFTPNAQKEEYIYNNPQTVRSNCHEFKNYPAINDEYRDINCDSWGCNEFGFYRYWWSNLPRNKGTNFDVYSEKNVLNNWWIYIFNPESVNK